MLHRFMASCSPSLAPPLAVGRPLPLDAVLDDPGVRLHVLERQALLGVKNK